MATSPAHIWVVTETHLVGHRFHDLKARMLRKGWDLYPAHATPNTKSTPGAAALELGADPGRATTGGVLVAARRWLGTTALCPITKDGVPGFVEPVGNNFSFMSWRTAGLTIAVGGIYLEPGLGPQGCNLERLAEVATFLTQLSIPFILAGDFNMEPSELMGTQWAHKLKAQIVWPDVPFTCTSGEGRVLDYYVVSKGLLPALHRITCSDATPWRPHLGLTLAIRARPREVFCYKQAVPNPFEPQEFSRLHGPDHQWASFRHRAANSLQGNTHEPLQQQKDSPFTEVGASTKRLSEEFAIISLAAEYHMHSRASQDSNTRSIGRGQAWKVRRVQLFDKRQADDLSSDPVSSFWSVLAARLSEYARFVDMARLAHPRAIWLRGEVLRSRAHSLLVEQLPDGSSYAQNVGTEARAWATWLTNGISAASLTEVQEKAQLASSLAKKALAKASYQRKRSWGQWLEKALEKGAGIAHKWASRPNRAVAQLAKVKDGLVHTHPDEVLAIRRQVWQEKWNRPDNDTSRALELFHSLKLAAQGEQMETITPSMVRRALAAFAGTKGLGLDLWHPKEVMSWPSEAIDDLVGLLNSIEESLAWPQQAILNKLVFLTKPNGDDRSIGLGAFLFRLWQKIRSPVTRSWEEVWTQEWDTAKKGSSAIKAALRRAVASEVAVLKGLLSAAVLWDLTSFFDTILPQVLIQHALELEYPARHLYLSLQVHLAPRVLVTESAQHPDPVVVRNSIMAGFTDSVTLTRVLLRKAIISVREECPEAPPEVYVDDMAQMATGDREHLLRVVPPAAACLHGAISLAGGIFSSKSTIVATSIKLARDIARKLARCHGIHVKVAQNSSDLGVDFAGGKKRRLATHKKRQAKGKVRLGRIATMVRANRKAASLTLTGAAPQILWGTQATGVAPSRMRSIRSSYAFAAGIQTRGRCTTTAIALRYGVDKDPAVAQPLLLLVEYIQMWLACPSLRQGIKDVWPGLVAQHSPKPIWRKVHGPIGAVVATWIQNGWAPMAPDYFVDPDGGRWEIQEGPLTPFAEAFRYHAIRRQWTVASKHRDGAGLEGMPSLYSLRKRLVKLRKDPKSRGFAGMLEHTAAAAIWTRTRLHEAGYVDDPRCQRCFMAPEDEFHRYWVCVCNSRIQDPAVKDTQPLMTRAREEHGLYPCFWHRGMMPAELYRIPAPPEACSHQTFGHFSRGGGVYATDGSGGSNTSDPRLRRCGWSVAHVGEQDELLGAAWGPLPGKQTVGRAELWALLFLINSAPGDIVVYIDCQPIYKRWRADRRSHTVGTAMGDLWQMFWQALDERVGSLTLHWVPSHLTTKQVEAGDIPLSAYVANHAADLLATEAASGCQVPQWLVDEVAELDKLTSQVQDRLVTINLAVCATLGPKVRVPKKARDAHFRSRIRLLARTDHRLSRKGKQWACSRCQESVTDSKLGTWLRKGPCQGIPPPSSAPAINTRPILDPHAIAMARRMHSSHRLAHHRGVFICRTCGRSASASPKSLLEQCSKAPTASGKASLSRWRKGEHPAGRTGRWPADTRSVDAGSNDMILEVI